MTDFNNNIYVYNNDFHTHKSFIIVLIFTLTAHFHQDYFPNPNQSSFSTISFPFILNMWVFTSWIYLYVFRRVCVCVTHPFLTMTFNSFLIKYRAVLCCVCVLQILLSKKSYHWNMDDLQKFLNIKWKFCCIMIHLWHTFFLRLLSYA